MNRFESGPMSNSARANRESGDNHEAMQIRPNEASMTATYDGDVRCCPGLASKASGR